MTAQPAVPAGFDPTDPDICLVGIPHEQFLELRRTAPVWWVEQTPESRAGFDGTSGFWAVSKHADVSAVSRNSKDFSSQEHGAIIRFAPDMTREQVELQSVMLINQDPPDHTKIRQIISRGFTPRSINGMHDVLVERANAIVDDAIAKGSGDLSAKLRPNCPCRRLPT